MNIDITNIKPLVDEIVNLYREELSSQHIDASGNLSSTLTSDIEIDDNRLRIYFNLEEYWKYVEYGRRAGKRPPIQAIEKWITIKPIIPQPYNNHIPTTKQLAYLIARKIGRDGIKGKYPLSKTLYSDRVEFILSEIRKLIIAQINNEISDVIPQ